MTDTQTLGDERHRRDDVGGRQRTIIVVNGREKTVRGDEISHEAVVQLGLDPVPTGPRVAITVAYSGARARPDSGTLVRGQSVGIKRGTKFDVRATDKS